MKKLFILFIVWMGYFICPQYVYPQTYVSGIISGTWTTAEGPYYVTDNCTIPKGDTLKIEPGVSVYIGMGLNIGVEGKLLAEGTQSRPITFTSPNSEAHWGTINLQYSGDDEISIFRHCEFNLAQSAISMVIGPNTDGILAPTIEYCSFRNCAESGIKAESYGYIRATMSAWYYYFPEINPVINGCIFESTNNGCVFFLEGYRRALAPPAGASYAYGHAFPTITNSVFYDLEGVAITFDIGRYYDSESKPIVANNTFIDCNHGIYLMPAYDSTITNNIFSGSETAIERSGDLSGKILHNCLNANSTDFAGYPDSFGTIVQTNANGDDCDIAFNIFLDPQVSDPAGGDFHLKSTSPCINAGTTDSAPENDIDQHLRPWREDEGIDIGADEYNGNEYQSPTIYSVTPTDLAESVGLDVQLTIIFTKEMSKATINTETIQLKSDDVPVSGSVSYSDKTATFIPGSDLSPATTYTATVSKEVRDTYGIMMAQDFSWSFATKAKTNSGGGSGGGGGCYINIIMNKEP